MSALVVVDADVLGRRRTGDETYVRELLRELGSTTRPFELAAVTRDPALLPAGVRPLHLPARNQWVRLGWRLPRLLRRLRPAVAHFQYVVPPGFGGTAVVTVHDLSFERHPDLMGRRDRFVMPAVVRRAVERSARVLTVSEWSRDDLLERYRLEPDKVVVTPNGVDRRFRPDGPRRDGPPYVLFVGAIQPRKDPLTAVRALRHLDPDLHLVMAGPHKLAVADVRREAADAGLADRVHLLGYVDDDELASLYRGAACLVMPSRYEGFGLPVLEAMASGTPVVAARASALPEVAGDAAVLVDPGDPEALADGVRRALADRDRWRAAGAARAAAFTWAETARRTAAVYEAVA